MGNPYLDAYRQQWARELGSDPLAPLREQPQPAGSGGVRHGMARRFSWAVPDDAALDTIAEHSPRGVVEIGAGGGYWAGMLRARGVDVVAYDPDPAGGLWSGDGRTGWHDGTRWSDVLPGDHTAVQDHPDRTLLLVWPSYSAPWTDEVLDLYEGDTVIYVGAASVTGSDRMHALLGAPCRHVEDDEDCDCLPVSVLFEQVSVVEIPQWYGIGDRLSVHHRASVLSTVDVIG